MGDLQVMSHNASLFSCSHGLCIIENVTSFGNNNLNSNQKFYEI